MDKISLQRINLMHPKLRAEALKAYNHINSKILGKGVRLRLTSTLRTFKEQDALYAEGRTVPGTIKTKARSGFSFHNYGLAFDIVILLDKDGDGVFTEVSWSTVADHDKDGIADWKEVAVYLKSLGWTWGGDFKNMYDPPHFEKTFGYTANQLLNKYNADDDFTEVIDGKTYTWVKI